LLKRCCSKSLLLRQLHKNANKTRKGKKRM
jgi:hypothetical protein